MFGRHGIVGGNLFLIAYVPAMVGPAERIFAESPQDVKWIALAVLATTVGFTVVSLRFLGGGGVGEPIGCLAGILVWAGRYAGPALASFFAPAKFQPDVWSIVGGSIPPVLTISALWLVVLAKRQ